MICIVEKGKWEGYFHSWITKERPNIAVITNKKYTYPSKKIKYKYGGYIGVDSGQIAVVDIDKYPKNEKEHNKWYREVVKVTLKNGGKIDGGYAFSSGWGDGSYRYMVGRVNRKVVQFIIYLIP